MQPPAFTGKGAFLKNYRANLKPRVVRMTRHPNALEEPEPNYDLTDSMWDMEGLVFPECVLNTQGPEFRFD